MVLRQCMTMLAWSNWLKTIFTVLTYSTSKSEICWFTWKSENEK